MTTCTLFRTAFAVAALLLPVWTSGAAPVRQYSDYMPEIDSRGLQAMPPPDDICLIDPTNASGQKCLTLLAGPDHDLSVGQVCVELVGGSSGDELKAQVTFETTGDWSLVRTKFWIGDIAQVPKIDGTKEIDLEVC